MKAPIQGLNAAVSSSGRRLALATLFIALTATITVACAPPPASTPTPRPTSTPRPSPSPTLTPSPSATSTPSPTATPTMTPTPTPAPAEETYEPGFLMSAPTEAGELAHPGWIQVMRWEPEMEKWSIELPVDGSWEFVRTAHINGRVSTGKFTLPDTHVPTMEFTVSAIDQGGADYLGVELECDSLITRKADDSGLEVDGIYNTGIAEGQGRIARAGHSPPGVSETPTKLAYVCVIVENELYLIQAWSAPASTEFDLLSMIYSFRVEG